MDTSKLFQEYSFSEAEKKFMQDSNTATTADMNKSRVVSDFVLGKKLEVITDKLIASNKVLSDSTGKYSRAMIYLTGGLILVGLLQIIFH
jgi:hypothetical protein